MTTIESKLDSRIVSLKDEIRATHERKYNHQNINSDNEKGNYESPIDTLFLNSWNNGGFSNNFNNFSNLDYPR